MNRRFCEGCFEKQIIIDRLTEENTRLKQLLRYRRRKEDGTFFGTSTPSAKLPVKPNTDADNTLRRGGAKNGHPGHGRKSVPKEKADRIIEVNTDDLCPRCGCELAVLKPRERTVIETERVRANKITYILHRKRCPKCKRVFSAKPKGVLQRSLFGNQMLTYIAVMHYLYGVPLGRLETQLKLCHGSIIQALHRLARIFGQMPQRLIEKYCESAVKHADETGWRTDGKNGYAWLFATEKMSIFRFRDTRSSSVPKEVFGEAPLPGVLVVDRYAGYNKAPCKIQYCYAHLLREVQDIEREYPDDPEASAFVNTVAPLISRAIGLRKKRLSEKGFKIKAAEIKAKLKQAMEGEAKNLAIRRIQDIFMNNESRLYHWAEDRNVPADNNMAERDLRPSVIARKTSFGSQSPNGAHTREVLMTTLATLCKNSADAEGIFKSCLDALAQDPPLDAFKYLYPSL